MHTAATLRSEIVKLLTLRSVWITALVSIALCIGIPTLTAPSIGDAIIANDPDLAPGTVPETVGLEWIGLGLIGIAIIGVIAASSEYVSKQVVTSLLAVPRRLQLALAKAAALCILVTVIGIVTIPTMSLLSQIRLGDISVIRDGVPETLVWRWVGGLVLWVATAQIGFALALLMRQALIPLLVMIVVSQLTLPLVNLVPLAQYLPFAAGTQLFDAAMITSSRPDAALTPAAAALTLAAWTGGLLLAAILRFRQRDTQA